MFESWRVLKEGRSEICVRHGYSHQTLVSSTVWDYTDGNPGGGQRTQGDKGERLEQYAGKSGTRTFCKIGSEILVQLVSELCYCCNSVGNWAECNRFLTQASKLWRERGSDRRVALALRRLSDTNRLMGLPAEGIWLAKESLEIPERLGNMVE